MPKLFISDKLGPGKRLYFTNMRGGRDGVPPPHIFVIFEFIRIKYISTFICQIEREREKERERERERGETDIDIVYISIIRR